jgi:hypothetical protein
MPRFFPERTIIWAEQEVALLRRFTLVAGEIGLFTGVLLRTANAVVMTYSGTPARWTTIAAWYLLAAIVLCGAATAHLGNFPVRQWVWRAPVFAFWETGGAALASVGLLVFHHEFWGSAHAHPHDWPTIVISTLLWHTLAVCAYAVVLAAVVEGLREVLRLREHVGGGAASTPSKPRWRRAGGGEGQTG